MRVRCLAVLLAWIPLAAAAQGFATLGEEAEEFALPVPGSPFDFPADHGPHPDFRIEWWYLTANLTGADGAEYGVQWTLFRTALRPETNLSEGWSSPQIWLGHAALTSASEHRFSERRARGGVGTAGAQAAPFAAWIDDWQMTSQAGPGKDALSALSLTARGADFAYALDLRADGPLVFHGTGGYSVKSPDGQASYYYSQPHFRVSGSVETAEGAVDVTGQAWLDREWSSRPLSADQQGWDWMALRFDSGAALMVAQVRSAERGRCPRPLRGLPRGICPKKKDGEEDFVFGSWIGADGNVRALDAGDLKLTPLRHATVAGRDLPVRWRVEAPELGVSTTVEALNPESWMATAPSYWEGPVRISGSHSGRGYLEMTGYAPRK